MPGRSACSGHSGVKRCASRACHTCSPEAAPWESWRSSPAREGDSCGESRGMNTRIIGRFGADGWADVRASARNDANSGRLGSLSVRFGAFDLVDQMFEELSETQTLLVSPDACELNDRVEVLQRRASVDRSLLGCPGSSEIRIRQDGARGAPVQKCLRKASERGATAIACHEHRHTSKKGLEGA